MGFKFKSNFLGLCVFVPNTDLNKSMRVLLIDGRAPGKTSNGLNHVSHRPALRFNLADIVEGSLPTDCEIIYSAADRSYFGQWYFNGDDLEIKVDGQALPDRELQILRAPFQADFSHIPTADQIYPELGGLDVRSACLADGIDLVDAGLVGRMRLTAGRMGAYAGKNGEHISKEKFTFTGLNNNYRQHLASGASFETEIAGETVELYSRQRGERFILRPADGKCVEVFIENLPPRGIENAKPQAGDTDIDFQLVYNIAQQQPPQLRVPVRAGMGPEMPRPLLCGGMVYNPADEA